MARKRVKLQWIADNAARKATYKKRMKGLMKKARELSILCGVDACLITYNRYNGEPEVWPSPVEAEKVVAAFRNRPHNDQNKKVLNQEIFTWQRILKARDEVVKQQMKNRKKEIENLRTQCLGGRLLEGLERKDLLDLTWAIDNQLEVLKKKLFHVPQHQVPRHQVAGIASGCANNMGTGIGDVPATAGHFPLVVPVPVTGAGGAAAAKTSFNLAIDVLNNQLLHTEEDRNENMSNSFGDALVHDVYEFWRNPYIH